jgi:hypothetical protein
MIGRLTGTLIEKNPPSITVDVHGLGYEVDVPMSTFYNLPATGEKVLLHTHLVVREDGHYLYGFATPDERAAFRQLLKISGIGARTALAVLSGMSVARTGAGGHPAGSRTPDQGARHRQENRRTPACWNCATACPGRRRPEVQKSAPATRRATPVPTS